MVRGCDEGLLEVVEIESLPAGADGILQPRAYLEGTITDCGPATIFYLSADVGRYIAYSPTRRSARPLISTHAEKGVDMNPHMPTSEQNSKRALYNNWEWWSDHGDEMNERFSTWLAR